MSLYFGLSFNSPKISIIIDGKQEEFTGAFGFLSAAELLLRTYCTYNELETFEFNAVYQPKNDPEAFKFSASYPHKNDDLKIEVSQNFSKNNEPK